MRDISFRLRVENNGVKLKNVPNVDASKEAMEFSFTDYVAKDPMSWGMVPEDPDDVDVESIADEMYQIYNRLDEEFPEVTVSRDEDGEMYLVSVVVDVPADPQRAERVAEQVAEALLQRQEL